MGLPRIIWLVRSSTGEQLAFYDREKAEAYAAEDDGRVLSGRPLQIRDAI